MFPHPQRLCRNGPNRKMEQKNGFQSFRMRGIIKEYRQVSLVPEILSLHGVEAFESNRSEVPL